MHVLRVYALPSAGNVIEGALYPLRSSSPREPLTRAGQLHNWSPTSNGDERRLLVVRTGARSYREVGSCQEAASPAGSDGGLPQRPQQKATDGVRAMAPTDSNILMPLIHNIHNHNIHSMWMLSTCWVDNIHPALGRWMKWPGAGERWGGGGGGGWRRHLFGRAVYGVAGKAELLGGLYVFPVAH